jgi:methylmalonyl-CoA/ethylmalonyl-CoA epimerase
MVRIEHIGIAVENLEDSIALYEQLLNTPCYKTETVAAEKVATAFFKVGESKIELLQGSDPDSVITKFVAKKGQGIHHIAYEVENIHAEMKRLAALGFDLLHPEPKRGADNKLVCFLHPKTSGGVLVELCQEIRS